MHACALHWNTRAAHPELAPLLDKYGAICIAQRAVQDTLPDLCGVRLYGGDGSGKVAGESVAIGQSVNGLFSGQHFGDCFAASRLAMTRG
jgi:hypothetical protein